MVPYNEIDADAPLMEMFAVHGCIWAKYIVAVGSIAGLTVSLLGSLFPMPRVIYAMAGDGLLFKSVYKRTLQLLFQSECDERPSVTHFDVCLGSWPACRHTQRPLLSPAWSQASWLPFCPSWSASET